MKVCTDSQDSLFLQQNVIRQCHEEVSCNIPKDTCENIKPGDKCIVHYHKEVMGYLVLKSLAKVE